MGSSGISAEDLKDQLALYESIINEDRQVILFDPLNGRIAEVHGEIGPDTKNVGVLVPVQVSTPRPPISGTPTAVPWSAPPNCPDWMPIG